MNRVEEGVANFRSFQAKGLDFFARSDERAMNDEKQRNKRDQEIKDAIKFRDARHTFYIAVLALILTGFEVYKLYRGH